MTSEDLMMVFEKMIDSQIRNTEALTSLREILNDHGQKIERIDVLMHNGFRSDIKIAVSDIQAIKIVLTEISKKSNDDTNKIDNLTKESTGQTSKLGSMSTDINNIKTQNTVWAKIVALVCAVGAIAATIVKFWPK